MVVVKSVLGILTPGVYINIKCILYRRRGNSGTAPALKEGHLRDYWTRRGGAEMRGAAEAAPLLPFGLRTGAVYPQTETGTGHRGLGAHPEPQFYREGTPPPKQRRQPRGAVGGSSILVPCTVGLDTRP